ncbi:MAG: hypothetical protein LBU32_14690 [Clostridiales bacterium]|jgi:hypothetical protein|nr:hypothetical protein [Clostridiales bacterium]
MFLSVFSDELFLDAKKSLPIIQSWGSKYVKMYPIKRTAVGFQNPLKWTC